MRFKAVVFGLACAVWIVALPFTIILAMMAPLLAEKGVTAGSGILVANFISFPLACLLGPIAGWIAWTKGMRALAWALVAAPLLWVAAPAVVWGVMKP
jgi:hypothetical protein